MHNFEFLFFMAGNPWDILKDGLDMKNFDFGQVRWDDYKWLEVAYREQGKKKFLKVFKREKDVNNLYGSFEFNSTSYKTVFAAYYELFSNSTGTFNEFA